MYTLLDRQQHVVFSMPLMHSNKPQVVTSLWLCSMYRQCVAIAEQHMTWIRTALLMQDYKAYQDNMEAHLQDKTFLLEHMKQLQPGNAPSSLPQGLPTTRYVNACTGKLLP